MVRIRQYSQSKLKIGMIKLFNWAPDFVPSKQKQTNVHVWARIHELPLEYFVEELVLYLAGGIGIALQADPLTINKTLGHFARVFVDVNLQQELPQRLVVERGGNCLELPITFEQLPPFCSHCSTIGHLVADCRVLMKARQKHSLNVSAKEGHRNKNHKAKGYSEVLHVSSSKAANCSASKLKTSTLLKPHSNIFAHLTRKFWGDEEDDATIENWETVVDTNYSAISNPAMKCIELE
ncbi:hypothetical protein LguiB_012844 [Lonicera macranthoides]